MYEITRATAEDVEQILSLQKLAFLSEAEIYHDFDIPPLKQTLVELKEELPLRYVLKCTRNGCIIGSVTGFSVGDTCQVGRLMVHPEYQGLGVGKRLMNEIERAFPEAKCFELFTGHRSRRNLSLYRKLGYRVTGGDKAGGQLTVIFMRKKRADTPPLAMPAGGDADAFRLIEEKVVESGVSFTLHRHPAIATMAEASMRDDFPLQRIVKTVAFSIDEKDLVLAVLRGVRRVDYQKLAHMLGVKRKRLRSLAPDEVRALLGTEPGAVSPIPPGPGVTVAIDDDVLAILPTVYFGCGTTGMTLELEPAALTVLTEGLTGVFSKP